MKAAHIYLSLSILSVLVELVEPCDLLTAAAVVGGVSILGGGIYSFHYHERCDHKWISLNRSGLQTELESNLFGQHIASPAILKAVKGFMMSPSHQKPLVLSLHGPTGTGKTYVSEMIANSIYKKGLQSEFVHLITSKDFPHASRINEYKVQLQANIERNVARCERSMFIFDEMDQMPPALIDAIKPYTDRHDELGGASYRNSIFIFLRAGGPNITATTLNLTKARRIREEVTLKHLEDTISLSGFKQNGGFFQSKFTDTSPVDFYVPFLPLERRHVIQCIRSEMNKQSLRLDWNIVNKLAEDLMYFPKPENFFSVMGCKTIQKRLSIYYDSS